MAFQLCFLFAVVANVLVAGQIPARDTDIETRVTLGQLHRLATEEPGRALVSIYNAGDHVRKYAVKEQAKIQKQIDELRLEVPCTEGLSTLDKNELAQLRIWNSQNYTTNLIHTPRIVAANKKFDSSRAFAKETLDKCPVACWNLLSLSTEVKRKMTESRAYFRKALATSINLVEEQLLKDVKAAQEAFENVAKECRRGGKPTGGEQPSEDSQEEQA